VPRIYRSQREQRLTGWQIAVGELACDSLMLQIG
jgi:hypothetical protein